MPHLEVVPHGTNGEDARHTLLLHQPSHVRQQPEALRGRLGRGWRSVGEGDGCREAGRGVLHDHMAAWLQGCVTAWLRGRVGAWRVHGAGWAWWQGTMTKVTLSGTYGISGSLSACTSAYARGHTRGRKERKGL